MAELRRVASRQYGLLSRAQLTAAGFDRWAIRWRVQTGELERLSEQLFGLTGTPPSLERTARAGLLLGGADAVVSHASAAWLHRLDGFKHPRHIDVSVPRNGPRTLDGITFHRRRLLPPAGDTLRHLRVTSLAHTLIDLAEDAADDTLELALDSAHRRKWNLEEQLDRAIAELTVDRAPHARRLLALLDARAGQHTDSALELAVARVLRAEGFPAWKAQHVVFDDGGQYVMRVDFAWPQHRVALHADGFRWHAQRVRADRDARQRSRLQALGWRATTVTNTTLTERAWRDDLRFLLNPQSRLPLIARRREETALRGG